MAVLTIAIAAVLRLLPLLLHKNNLGVDHWFWRAYISVYREKKEFPPEIPQYVLDEHQWYPPVFPLLLSIFSEKAFNFIDRWVAIIIDLIRMCLMLTVVYHLSAGDTYALLMAGLIYATTPILIFYNTQLNPRALGAITLDCIILLLIFYYYAPSISILIAVVILSALVLLTHKMTTQLLWFMLLGAFLITRNAVFLYLFPLPMMLAWLASKGFYWQVLKAHWDIVSFWTRNWAFLGADPIQHSPIYGQPTRTKGNLVFKSGWMNGIKRLLSIFFGAYCPSVSITIIILVFKWPVLASYDGIVYCFVLIMIFAILTVGIPCLRGLGYGNIYLYNAAFPNAILLGLAVSLNSRMIPILLVMAVVMNLAQVVRSFQLLTRHTGVSLPVEVVERIRTMDEGTWICYPMQLCEHVAVLAGQKVLWGGHGYGMAILSRVFPVIAVRFEFLIKEYQLRYVLVHQSYYSSWNRVDIEQRIVFEDEQYRIYEIGTKGGALHE